MRLPRITTSNVIGIGSLVLLTYDALNTGAYRGMQRANTEIGNRVTDVFVSHQSANSPSILREKMRSWFRNFTLDDQIYPQYSKIKNVLFSCVGETARYAVPFACVAGTFLPQPFGGISAALLLAGGAKYLLTDIMGVGQKRKI